jgi:amino acid adenylation domain-containing protein
VEVLQQLKQTVLSAFENSEVPFDALVEALNPERTASYSPVFQSLFTLMSFPMEFRAPDGLLVELLENKTNTARFDLALDLSPMTIGEHQGDYVAAYEYATDLFDESTISHIHRHFEAVLRAIVAGESFRIDDLPLIGFEEEKLLSDWNSTDIAHDRTLCVHEMFEAAARATPEATAIIAADARLNYRQLDQRSNQLAHLLIDRGISRGALVAICVDRTADIPIAMAAVLKTGAAYVPLDPSHPSDRLRYTIENAGVSCVIAQSQFAASLAATGAPCLMLDQLQPQLESNPTTAPDVRANPEDLAYVIYTSGSTGRPKGVQVEHRNLVSFLDAMRRQPGLDARETSLAITTLSFDIAGLEIWLPLTVGARVVIASRTDALDGERLIHLLHNHDVSLFQATPSTWRLLLAAGWSGKHDLKALCGGEALPRDLAGMLVERVGELWNMYGPTETTVWSTLSRVIDPAQGIWIGRPIANTRVYVLDSGGRPTPIGVTGELCIGGEGVARGYRNLPELTADKFVTLSLPGRLNERLYRTGDIARLRSDGQLEFLGRRDHQVKIRGYRIELGEIEAVLTTHEGVKESVVLAREDGPGDQRLVAFVTLSAGASFDEEVTRNKLRGKLPEYMVPNHFVVLPALPLTPNGKIDRKALTTMRIAPRLTTVAADTLMNSVQRQIADVWRDVLRVERIGLHDNFFDLGGHSLLLIKLQTGLKRELKTDVTLVELFQQTTVAAQAERFSSPVSSAGLVKRAQERAARRFHG